MKQTATLKMKQRRVIIMTLKDIEHYHDIGLMPDYAYYQQNGKTAQENYIEQMKKRQADFWKERNDSYYKKIQEKEIEKELEETIENVLDELLKKLNL